MIGTMATIDITPMGAPTHSGLRHGLWWLPGSSARAPGTVELGPDNRAVLTVQDQLVARDDGRNGQVVHGALVDGTAVTLGAARLTRTTGRSGLTVGGNTYSVVQVWEAAGYFTDAHLDRPDSELFDTVSFATPLLQQWVDPPTVRDQADFDDHDVASRRVVRVGIPASVTTDLPDIGRVTLWHPEGFESTNGGRRHVYTYQPTWTVHLETPRTAGDIYTNVALPLLVWTTFATGAGDRFTRLTLGRNTNPDRSLTWYPYGWSIDTGTTRANLTVGHLLPYQTVGAKLPELLSRWFTLYANAPGPLVQSCLELLRGPSRHGGDDFLTTMRAAEGYHFKLHAMTRMPPADWDVLLGRVLGATRTEQERDIVNGLLSSGNRPTLRRRLKDLQARASPEVQSIARAKRSAVEDAVALRNDFTHGSDPVMPDRFMNMGTGKLVVEFILRSVILQDLGFSATETDTLLQGSDAWAWLQSVDPEAGATPQRQQR